MPDGHALVVVSVADVDQLEQSSRPVVLSDEHAGCWLSARPRMIENRRAPVPP